MMTWVFLVTLNLSTGPVVFEVGQFDSKTLCQQQQAYFDGRVVLPQPGASWSKSLCEPRPAR